MVLMNNLVGKRVYNNSSYSPSQGTVNPQGYIQREINKPAPPNQGVYGGVSHMGNDGQSDTRSGLAAQALQQRISSGGDTGYQAPGQTQTRAPNTLPAAFNPNLPEVTISPIGELKLPFNFKYASNVLSEKQKADAALLKLQQQRQQELREYLQQYRQANSEYKDTTLNSLNDASSRGVVFSSGYGKRIASDATAFNNLVNRLDTSEGDSRNSALSQRSAINDAFKTALSQYANQAGYDLDQNAGTYHLNPRKR